MNCQASALPQATGSVGRAILAQCRTWPPRSRPVDARLALCSRSQSAIHPRSATCSIISGRLHHVRGHAQHFHCRNDRALWELPHFPKSLFFSTLPPTPHVQSSQRLCSLHREPAQVGQFTARSRARKAVHHRLCSLQAAKSAASMQRAWHRCRRMLLTPWFLPCQPRTPGRRVAHPDPPVALAPPSTPETIPVSAPTSSHR
jgi:hypothetical protein